MMTTPFASTTEAPTRRRRRPRIYHDPSLARHYPLELIQRWEETLQALDQFRFLTNRQVAELLFIDRSGPDGQIRSERAARATCNEKCLLRLKDRGLIERIPVYRSHPTKRTIFLDGANLLTADGASLVQELTGNDQRLRWHRRLKEWAHRSVDHELAINDLGIGLIRASERACWRLPVWLDDDQLAGLRDAVTFTELIPDAFALIETGTTLQPLFFEVDRGTESVAARGGSTRDWRSKVERYSRLLNDPALIAPLWVKLGLVGAPVRPPLVLTVTTGETRQRNLLAATKTSPTPSRFWYTTAAKLQQRGAIIEDVWRTANHEEMLSLSAQVQGTGS